MKTNELKPVYDSRQSFYGKALVEETDTTISLISFKSRICTIEAKGLDDVAVKIYNVRDYYGNSLTFSKTSLRHLKEFLKQNGLKAESKAQIEADYDVYEGGNTDAIS